MDLLFPAAYAQDAGVSAGAGGFDFIILIVFFLFLYFIIIRPQTKRAKEHRELIGAITKGDEVITSGGILGKVTKVNDDYIALEVANNTEVKVQKIAISAALPKGTIKSI